MSSDNNRQGFQDGAMLLVWKWVMRQIWHNLDPYHMRMLHLVFHQVSPQQLINVENGRSYRSVMIEIMEIVYVEAVTKFVSIFREYMYDGSVDINDAWLDLVCDVQNMISDIITIIAGIKKEHSEEDKMQLGAQVVTTSGSKRGRDSTSNAQDTYQPPKKKRRLSLTF